MFDSLSDRIRVDEQKSPKERALQYFLYLVLAFVLFGGLFLVVKHLD
jgi:hypothetical protein